MFAPLRINPVGPSWKVLTIHADWTLARSFAIGSRKQARALRWRRIARQASNYSTMWEIGQSTVGDERFGRSTNICYRAMFGAYSTMRERNVWFTSNGCIRIMIGAIVTLEQWRGGRSRRCKSATQRIAEGRELRGAHDFLTQCNERKNLAWRKLIRKPAPGARTLCAGG